MALVRYRSLSCRGRVDETVVAPFDIRMPFVAGDQHEGMPTKAVPSRTARWHSYPRDLPAIIDSERAREMQGRVWRNHRIQIDDLTVLPQHSVANNNGIKRSAHDLTL